MRHTLCEVTVDEHLFNIFQTVEQTLRQMLGLGNVLRHFQLSDAKSFTHADALVRGQSATAHAALVTAAVHLRFQAHARFAAHVQSANAFGAIGFVRGQAHQIDRKFSQIDVYLAGGLRGIHVKDDAFFTTHIADGDDVLNNADFVVHVHDADE